LRNFFHEIKIIKWVIFLYTNYKIKYLSYIIKIEIFYFDVLDSLAGMSRSVTVAVAYIISTTNLSWKDALKVVRVGRAVANPNIGFQQQLEDFESIRLQDVMYFAFKICIVEKSIMS
jgi:hypothetical protein